MWREMLPASMLPQEVRWYGDMWQVQEVNETRRPLYNDGLRRNGEQHQMRYLIEIYESGANRTDCVIYFADLSVAAVALESFRMNATDDWEIVIGALTDNDTYNTFHPGEYDGMESVEAFTELARQTLHIDTELAKENNTI